MCELFNDYLNFCLKEPVKNDSPLIQLKKYQILPDKNQEESLKLIYKKVSKSNCLSRYAFLIGYDWHINQMQDFYTIYNDFRAKSEITYEYAEACFLFLQFMNEMMFDEYRTLTNDLDRLFEELVQDELTPKTELLLLACLYYKYINPKYLDYLKDNHQNSKVYENFKSLLEKRMPVW